MKTNNGKLSAITGVEAKIRIHELQAKLLQSGYRARDISPGKIAAELILREGAFEYLKKQLIKQNS